MNIDPKIWGKPGWKFISSIVLSYPENPTDDYIDGYYSFFNNLQFVLPCEKCRYNYGKHLSKYPLTYNILYNRQSLIKWYINIRNESNKSIGKNEIDIDYIIGELYGNDNKNIILIITIFIIVFSFVVIKFYKIPNCLS